MEVDGRGRIVTGGGGGDRVRGGRKVREGGESRVGVRIEEDRRGRGRDGLEVESALKSGS